MTTAVLDPFDVAVQAAESAGRIIGKLEVDRQWVILKKGQRKQAWIEGMDTDGKVAELTFRLNPLDCTGLTYHIERQIIGGEWGEWPSIVWPSIRELGVKSLYEINGKYASVTMVKNGESYIKSSTGEKVEKTTFKFLAIYNTEAEAVAAWENPSGSQPAAQRATGSAPGVEAAPANDTDREKCLPFLPTLVKMAGGDTAKLAELIATTDPVHKFFTIDSPEVVALLKAA